MQRQRGELVPVAEALADLGGPVQALRETPPPAQRGFTLADQVNQLVSASETTPDLGFMGRTMALCSLPRTNPGNRKEYIRCNGPYTLGMTAGLSNKLPFGNYPRLLLAWVSTEAVRTQSRELVLGKSLAEFMRELGIHNSGGREGTKLRNQMRRLFGCTVSLIYKDENAERYVNSPVTVRGEFWWNERKPDQRSLWDSTIVLGEDLFNEIIRHPVPLDMNTLTALKRSTLGLDLYLWLVYRTFPLRAPLRLSWRQVYRQFGAHPDNASDKAQNQSSRHGPPSGGPDFQRPSNRAPATRVGVSKSLLGRCLCGFEASRTRRASTTSARRDRARPGVVSCSRFSSGATRNGEMRRQIGW